MSIASDLLIALRCKKTASLGAAMKSALRFVESIFLLPGNMVADLLGAAEA